MTAERLDLYQKRLTFVALILVCAFALGSGSCHDTPHNHGGRVRQENR